MFSGVETILQRSSRGNKFATADTMKQVVPNERGWSRGDVAEHLVRFFNERPAVSSSEYDRKNDEIFAIVIRFKETAGPANPSDEHNLQFACPNEEDAWRLFNELMQEIPVLLHVPAVSVGYFGGK